MNNTQKKYLYISLSFNIIVIFTFIFFIFVYPHFQQKKVTSDTRLRQMLSPDQHKALDSLQRVFQESEYPLKIKNIELRLRLWEELMNNPIDSQRVNQAINNLIEGENTYKVIHYQYYLKEKYLLTPDQRIEYIKPIYGRLKAYLNELTATSSQP